MNTRFTELARKLLEIDENGVIGNTTLYAQETVTAFLECCEEISLDSLGYWLEHAPFSDMELALLDDVVQSVPEAHDMESAFRWIIGHEAMRLWLVIRAER